MHTSMLNYAPASRLSNMCANTSGNTHANTHANRPENTHATTLPNANPGCDKLSVCRGNHSF